jgi:hypothetical protein
MLQNGACGSSAALGRFCGVTELKIEVLGGASTLFTARARIELFKYYSSQ